MTIRDSGLLFGATL